MADPNGTAAAIAAAAKVFSTKAEHPATLSSSPIVINPTAVTHPTGEDVPEKLYSGFLEHLGRCIYGGLVDDPKAPSPENLLVKQDDGSSLTKGKLAWRKDVMDLIGAEGDLQVPMLRWPGGNYVSNFHWQDSIGPVEQRPKRIELAWLSSESNKFGLDEFIDYCRAVKCEPYLCLNMGTGSYEEALSWLEYCNGTGDTYWAELRRKNTGRDEPHNVKLWGLGNEMWGPWQVGNLTPTEYVRKARMWAHGLKLVDPTIKLVGCGKDGSSEWDREVTQGLIKIVDFHSIHWYSMLGHDRVGDPPNVALYEKNVFGPAAAERGIEICQSLIDLAKIDRGSNLYDYMDGKTPDKSVMTRDVKICYDEWNVWDETKAPGSVGLEQNYDYTDMLGFCAWLNVLVRQSHDVTIACLAQSVNVISPLMTSPTGVMKQTTYFPLKLFSNYMKGGKLLTVPKQKDVYTGPTYPSWIQTMLYPTYIDITAIVVEKAAKSSVRVSVINRHPTADWSGDFQLTAYDIESVEVHEIYSDDLDATNTFEKPDTITPTVTKYSGSEWSKKSASWKVRKHSWQFLIFEGSHKV